MTSGRQVERRVDGVDFTFDLHQAPGGVELAYTEQGAEDGPPIVLVNNPFVPGAGWYRFTTKLAERNRLVVYDLRNQGASTDGPALIDDHVADLASLIEALPHERPYVVGHSIGCQICAAFAAERSDLIRGLVLAAPVVNPTGSARRQLVFRNYVEEYDEGGLPALFDALYMITYSERAVKFAGRAGRWGFRERFIRLNADRDVGVNLRGMSDSQKEFAPDLAAIDVPTLLVCGEDDGLSPASALRETAELIPDCELVLLKAVAHNVYLEDNRGFQEAVQAFVDRVEPR